VKADLRRPALVKTDLTETDLTSCRAGHFAEHDPETGFEEAGNGTRREIGRATRSMRYFSSPKTSVSALATHPFYYRESRFTNSRRPSFEFQGNDQLLLIPSEDGNGGAIDRKNATYQLLWERVK
jgi:hypothetical protein